MFERPHHQRITKLLSAFNPVFLRDCECYFGGGTAIVLALDEYRHSDDVDFLCSSKDGYRKLRNAVSNESLGELMAAPVDYAREVRSDRYGIRTFIRVDDKPIKVEIVNEARIELSAPEATPYGPACLSKVDMYAEKLLANADRALDASVRNRDIIDLAMMIWKWGPIPELALEKTKQAYGAQINTMFGKAVQAVSDSQHLMSCLVSLQMKPELLKPIQKALGIQARMKDEP